MTTPTQFAYTHSVPAVMRGQVTLVGGTATVVTSAAGSDSIILLSHQSPSATIGVLSAPIASRTSTSFLIQSSAGADASVVGWMIIWP